MTRTSAAELVEKASPLLGDRSWRLKNLYFIIDKDGKRVQFIPNNIQTELNAHMWYLNLIL